MVESIELLKKLQVKAGMRLRLINAPRSVAEALNAGAEVEIAPPGEPFDGAIAFCDTPAEVAALAPELTTGLPPDGLLWFAYRKGGAAKASGLSRDGGWAPLAQLGFRPVRSIAFDDVWTGLRFRETVRVKAKPGSQFASR